MRVITKRFTLFALLWLVLSRGAVDGLVMGLMAAVAATWMSLRLLPPDRQRLDIMQGLALLPGFTWRSVRGGLDVARRALDPRLPVDPGWITYRTRLPRGLPRVSFGSETSLLPGSLVAGGRDDLLYVHCLDRGQDVQRVLAAEEARVARAWPTAGASDE